PRQAAPDARTPVSQPRQQMRLWSCISRLRRCAAFPLAMTGVVTMQQLRAHGGALGLTVAGSVDLHASSVDLQGTIIPLYKVNTVVGKIPIVGDLLLGGEGQGLVAMAAHVTGRLPDPQVSVNPASVVTPGFLRGFFDLFEG